jgi:hypothetical protein
MTANKTHGAKPGKVTPKKIATGGKSTTATTQVSTTCGNSTDTNPDQLELNLTPERDDKPRSKLENMLRIFMRGASLNRFEAEDHHDHCLHSTVSTLQNDYGILIARKSETVPCLGGRSTTRCSRYWLDTSPDNLAAARALLAMLEAK